MVPAGTGPLEVVTQVHATGDNVRYTILAPVTPELFVIDESEQSSRGPQGHPVCILVPNARFGVFSHSDR